MEIEIKGTLEMIKEDRNYCVSGQVLERYIKSQQEEIQLLNKIIKEAINLPKGIEPHIYSDYKYNNNGK